MVGTEKNYVIEIFMPPNIDFELCVGQSVQALIVSGA